MQHYVAFLRGINLGHRRIKMDRLRQLFEEMKFTGVATFIASGNVIFSSPARDGRRLAAQIEQHLAESLGYTVDTFVRTRAEVAAVAAFRPFSAADLAHPGNTIHAGFWRDAPSAEQARGLLDCRTPVDEFCVSGREFYWLCRIRTPESKVWASPAMKALKLPSTSMRNVTNLRKLVALFPARSK